MEAKFNPSLEAFLCLDNSVEVYKTKLDSMYKAAQTHARITVKSTLFFPWTIEEIPAREEFRELHEKILDLIGKDKIHLKYIIDFRRDRPDKVFGDFTKILKFVRDIITKDRELLKNGVLEIKILFTDHPDLNIFLIDPTDILLIDLSGEKGILIFSDILSREADHIFEYFWNRGIALISRSEPWIHKDTFKKALDQVEIEADKKQSLIKEIDSLLKIIS